MAATEVLEQRVADLVLLAEIRELVLQTIVLLDDADDKIQEAPHLLEKIGIDDTTIERETQRLRDLLDRVSQAKDAMQRALAEVPASEAASH